MYPPKWAFKKKWKYWEWFLFFSKMKSTERQSVLGTSYQVTPTQCDKWTEHQCLSTFFPFSFHFKGCNSLSRIKCFTDMNSKSPSTKMACNSERWEVPAGHLVDKHAHDRSQEGCPGLPTELPPQDPTQATDNAKSQGSTYPQYVLWTLAQQADFQKAFPPVATSYLVAGHQARAGVLWSCKITQLQGFVYKSTWRKYSRRTFKDLHA